MVLLAILASITHKKIDVYNGLAFSLLIQIIYNPYCIFDIGLQLSYLGVIGILLFYKPIYSFVIKHCNLEALTKELVFKESNLTYKKKLTTKIKDYILKTISLTLSANLLIIPIIIYNYNTISFTFIISNLLSSIIVGPLIIVGYISIVFNIPIIIKLFGLLVEIFTQISIFCGNLSLSQIYLTTPNVVSMGMNYIATIVAKWKNSAKLNFISVHKRKKIIILSLIVMVLSHIVGFYNINSNNLIINVIDVGQGDGILIRYNNIKILIDGGGDGDNKNNVGKNILLPYLLDRKIKTLDYVIISHFDSDHCLGALYVMQKIRVKNVIIGYQQEEYDNYGKMKEIASARKINIATLEPKHNLLIDRLQIEHIWPIKKYMIAENGINNNSLVFKLNCNNTSIMFTGDIEKEAELAMLDYYQSNPKKLKADILKIPHHGSTTSSTQSFLDAVQPKIALIGVGKNNKFGHPNSEVIEKITNMRNENISNRLAWRNIFNN